MSEISSFELDAIQSVNDEIKAMVRKSDELSASVRQKLSDMTDWKIESGLNLSKRKSPSSSPGENHNPQNSMTTRLPLSSNRSPGEPDTMSKKRKAKESPMVQALIDNMEVFCWMQMERYCHGILTQAIEKRSKVNP